MQNEGAKEINESFLGRFFFGKISQNIPNILRNMTKGPWPTGFFGVFFWKNPFKIIRSFSWRYVYVVCNQSIQNLRT